MILNPYKGRTLAHKLAFVMDNKVLPSLPLLYEGLVIPLRRRVYDAMVKSRVNDLISKAGGIDAHLFRNIEIETVNRCNNDCQFCPANKRYDRRPLGKMDEKLFRSIIEQLKNLNFSHALAMYSNNEPLLDPRAVDFCAHAKDQLPKAFVYMFTNGTLLDAATFGKLMGCLDKLVIDNYSDDLRPTGQVREIIKECRKNAKWSSKTVIVLRKKSEFRNNRAGRAPNRRSLVPLTSPCLYPFSQLVVRPDGKLSLCCNDVYGEITLGDLMKEGLLEAWQGEKFKAVRSSMMKGRANLALCCKCDNITAEHIELAPHRITC